MNIEAIAITLIIGLITAFLGYFISRAKSARLLATQQLQAEQQKSELTTLQDKLSTVQGELEQSEESLHELHTRVAVTKSELDGAVKGADLLGAELQEARANANEKQDALSEAEQSHTC